MDDTGVVINAWWRREIHHHLSRDLNRRRRAPFWIAAWAVLTIVNFTAMVINFVAGDWRWGVASLIFGLVSTVFTLAHVHARRDMTNWDRWIEVALDRRFTVWTDGKRVRVFSHPSDVP